MSPPTKSITALTITFSAFMFITIYYRIPFILLSVHLLITLLYLIVQCWQKQTDEKFSQIFLHGEALTTVLYTVWVGVLQSGQYIYYLPMCVAMCGRVYDLMATRDKRSESITQNYIVLQGKIELCIMIYLTIVFLVNTITQTNTSHYYKVIIMYILAILLFRLKYQLSYSFRTAISQIHLFYDRLAKKLKFRRCYQRFYKYIVTIFIISEYYSGKKKLRY